MGVPTAPKETGVPFTSMRHQHSSHIRKANATNSGAQSRRECKTRGPPSIKQAESQAMKTPEMRRSTDVANSQRDITR